MNTDPVPLRRRILAYTARGLVGINLVWVLWGLYLVFQWLRWFHFNEQTLPTWLLLVVGIIYLASWVFCVWFFRWVGIVVGKDILNR